MSSFLSTNRELQIEVSVDGDSRVPDSSGSTLEIVDCEVQLHYNRTCLDNYLDMAFNPLPTKFYEYSPTLCTHNQ